MLAKREGVHFIKPVSVSSCGLVLGAGVSATCAQEFQQVWTLPEWAFRCLGKPQAFSSSSWLNPETRRELVFWLLRHPAVIARCPELRRRRRQPGFERQLEAASQALRLGFAHEEEAHVCFQRLDQGLGRRPLREEVWFFAHLQEVSLKAMGAYDLPLLLSQAREQLAHQLPSPPEGLSELVFLYQRTPEGLERDFWDQVQQALGLRVTCLSEIAWRHLQPTQPIQVASSVAAHAFFHFPTPSKQELSEHTFWLSSDPEICRLGRRLLERGKDPFSFWKAFLWPLECVITGFERGSVLGQWRNMPLEAWKAFQEEGWTHAGPQDLSSSGKAFSAWLPQARFLQAAFGKKQTYAQLKKSYEAFFAEKTLGFQQVSELSSEAVVLFFERILNPLAADLILLGEDQRAAFPLFWWARLQARLEWVIEEERQALCLAPPPEPGVPLFAKLTLVGVSPRDLQHDPWSRLAPEALLPQERRLLASEFQVLSPESLFQERLEAFQVAVEARLQPGGLLWIQEYAENREGASRESLMSLLRKTVQAWSFLEGSAHEEVRKTFIVPAKEPIAKLAITSFAGNAVSNPSRVITAQALDRFSRCAFHAWVVDRVRLRDLREPEKEGCWPQEARHFFRQALQLGPSVSLQTLHTFFQTHRPRGFLRWEAAEKRWLGAMHHKLQAHWTHEQAFRQRAGTTAIADQPWKWEQCFELEVPGTPSVQETWTVFGEIDRVEETAAGGVFFIQGPLPEPLPHGKHVWRQPYRPSGPLAAWVWEQTQAGTASSTLQSTPQKVLGLQWLAASQEGARRSGIFFKPYNGPKGLTQVRGDSQSLFDLPTGSSWAWVLSESVLPLLKRLAAGDRTPQPFLEDFCHHCSSAALCQWKRRGEAEKGDE